MRRSLLSWGIGMGKKKREHVVFDRMEKVKKRIAFGRVNRLDAKRRERVRMLEKWRRAER